MLKIIIFVLAVSCESAPVSPDRVEGNEQTSANSCPAGSSPSDQCPPGTGGTPAGPTNPGTPGTPATTGGTPADLNNPVTPAETADGTTPAETADGTTPAKTSCLPMETKYYRAGHLTLGMTVEEQGGGCRINLVFKPDKTMPFKKYKRTVGRSRGGSTNIKELPCKFDAQAKKDECYYKLVTTFPSGSVTSLSYIQDTKWYDEKCSACFEKNGDSYTIKYLNIDGADDIKIGYLFYVVNNFDLGITIDGELFDDPAGNLPQISKN